MQFSDVISDELEGKRMLGSKMEIVLKDGPVNPRKATTARQIPHHFRDRADEIIATLLRDGIIKPVKDCEVTVFCAPAFFVPKSNSDKLRFVVDLSSLNTFVARPTHTFMSPTEVLNSIPGDTKFLTKLDCVCGYWQVELTTESSYKTCFLIPQGRFRFTRAPMGLSSSSDVFCQKTDEALFGLPGLIKLVDDLLVVAPTFELLKSRVTAVLQRCRERNITISKAKLEVSNKVKFAGYIVSDEGVSPDPEQIASILALKPPKDVSALRSFLGAVNQLSIFCPDLSHLTNLNRQLLKKGTEYIWTPEHQAAFDAVKAAMAHNMKLNFFDPSMRIELLTDASRINGLGYALLNRDENDKPYLIQCGSRSLTGAESRYATIELEFCCILWSITKCRHFLIGSPRFTVVTDHRPLLGIMSKPMHEVANNRLLNIKLKLTDYTFDIVWCAGKVHFIADILSRNPCFEPAESDDIIECAAVNAVVEKTLIDPNLKALATNAKQDADYCALLKAVSEGRNCAELSVSHPAHSFKNVFDELSIHDNLVVFNDRIVIPKNQIQHILRLLHSSHQAHEKTMREARSLYYWPTQSRDVKNMVLACRECQKLKPSQQAMPLMQTEAEFPMQMVSIDFFKSEGGADYLVMADRYSGYPLCEQMRSTTTTALISKLESWFSDLSAIPSHIRSDGGPQLTSAQFEAWCADNGIVHEQTSSHYPQANGHGESAVKQVKYLLQKTGGKNSQAFKKGLIAYRNSPRKSGFSPCMLFFGRRMRSQLPALPSHYVPVDADKAENCVAEQSIAAKKQFDKHARDMPELDVGTRVYVQNWRNKKWDCTGTITEKRDTGRSYLVQIDEGSELLRNRKFLRPVHIPDTSGATENSKIEKRVRFNEKVIRHTFLSD